MHGHEAWDFLEPTLTLIGIQVIPGEPGGFITTPGFPDPGTGSSLGGNVWKAVDALAKADVTPDQLEAVRHVLDAVAKVVKYHTVQRRFYDTDALKQMFRDWPDSVS